MVNIQIKELSQETTPVSTWALAVQKALGGDFFQMELGDVIELSLDATPQLGGNLDLNSKTIGDAGSGTVEITDDVKISGADAKLILVDDNDVGSNFTLDRNSDVLSTISSGSDSGASNLRINVLASDGTGAASLQVFRATNTTGPKGFTFYKGDGSATIHALTGVDGTQTAFAIGGGDVGIGSSVKPTANGGFVLYFGDNTADPTMGNNTAGLFGKDVAGTVEMQAVDEAGNVSQLTSHYQPAGKPQYADVPFPTHTITSHNMYTDKKVTYDLHALAKAVEGLTGEKVIYVEDTGKARDWNTDQQMKVDERSNEIAEWEALPEDDRGEEPQAITLKPKPDWIKG